MSSITDTAFSIGLKMLLAGLSWMIKNDVLNVIKTRVLAMTSSSLSNEDKHKAVLTAAREVEEKVRSGLQPYRTTLLDAAIKIVVLSVT